MIEADVLRKRRKRLVSEKLHYFHKNRTIADCNTNSIAFFTSTFLVET